MASPSPSTPTGQQPGAIARNPGKTSGTAGAAVAALIGLGASFGLPITEQQTNAILAVVAIFAPLIVGFWADRKTTPYVAPRTVDGRFLIPAPGPSRLLKED